MQKPQDPGRFHRENRNKVGISLLVFQHRVPLCSPCCCGAHWIGRDTLTINPILLSSWDNGRPPSLTKAGDSKDSNFNYESLPSLAFTMHCKLA